MTSGLKEGRYYLSKKEYVEPLTRILGFKPYPGTLNIKICSTKPEDIRSKLIVLPSKRVEGFRANGVQYFAVSCIEAVIRKGYREIRGAILLIDKTKHGPEIIEFIAPVYLREALDLKDGDFVEIRVLSH